MLNMNACIGSHDIVFITLDTLRFDVAERCMAVGRTPNLQRLVGAWERRHTPATFTYAAHQAFFAGFLPTPIAPGPHPRLFAMAFEGSETTVAETAVFKAPNLVHGLADAGYHTIGIGGVGFFNKRNPLGNVLPGLFAECHWSEAMGVTSPTSTECQVALARSCLAAHPEQPVFLFINVCALHQPNNLFLDPTQPDSPDSQAAALAYVDGALGPLIESLEARGNVVGIICSDHGTAYGEDGYSGHRLSHPVVLDVPYGEFCLTGGTLR